MKSNYKLPFMACLIHNSSIVITFTVPLKALLPLQKLRLSLPVYQMRNQRKRRLSLFFLKGLLTKMSINWYLKGLYSVISSDSSFKCPIYNGTIESFIWSIMLNILSFFWVKTCLVRIILFLLVEMRNVAFFRESTIENNQFSKL